MNKDVLVIIGTGGIGNAIARRSGFGKAIILADISEKALARAAAELEEAGYEVEARTVDVSSRESVRSLAAYAASRGTVKGVVNTAGLSPNMASATKVLEVDLYGAAVVFEEFEGVIAAGGAGLIISSMAGHMLPPLDHADEDALAFTPAEQLLALPMLSEENIPDSMAAYCVAKKANHLRVRGCAMQWGTKGARVNSISPGIIATALARHELDSEIGDGYRAFIAASPAGRLASPDEVAVLANYLLGSDAGFVTGSDFLIDGGVIAAMRAGKVALPA